MIEGQVAFTASSDKTKKENFQPVDGEAVLGKIRGFELSSWNFIGHDPKEFRHYGPMAQDFFAAFGHDGVGQIGSETTINSGDLAGILMIAVQALEKRTAELKQKEAQIAVLESKVEDLKAKHAYFETVAARLEALELRQNPLYPDNSREKPRRQDGRSDADFGRACAGWAMSRGRTSPSKSDGRRAGSIASHPSRPSWSGLRLTSS